MPPHEHRRCDRCGRDSDGRDLHEHVERRHPERDVHWWVVAEEPGTLPFED